MNWNKIDLNSPSERSQDLIDGLSFATLMLEIECNLPTIDEKTVTSQFELDLQIRIEEARDIFAHNLKNIVKQAKKERTS